MAVRGAALAGVILVSLCGLPLHARAEGASEVIDRAIRAYGGAQALTVPMAIRQRCRVRPKRRHAGQIGELLRVIESAKRLRVEIRYPGESPEVRVLDGAAGWRNGAEVAGPPRDAMVLQAARLRLPFLLAQRAGDWIDRGTTVHEGLQLRTLELPLGPHLAVRAHIDPATGRILRSEGALDLGGGQAMTFVTTYDDFRQVKGLLFAFREANFAGAVQVAETEIDAIEILDRAPPGSFAP